MINPDCTPGWTEDAPYALVRACCGCGWTQDGFRSKGKALAAQKAHRFPPIIDPEPLEPGPLADTLGVPLFLSPQRAPSTSRPDTEGSEARGGQG